MPRYLTWLFWTCLTGTGLTLLMILFGPQEGLETLATGLLAYFVLLYHIPIGLVFIAHGFSAERRTASYWLIMVYFTVIWGIGAWQYIVINDLDDAARDMVDAQRNPTSHQLRELGERLYRQRVFEQRAEPADLEQFRSLATMAERVNQRDSERRAPLWYAAVLGDTEAARSLLDKGAATDDKSLYWTTPLAAAVDQGHVEVVQLLLDYGADPNEGENQHYPSVSLATKHGNLEMVDALIAGAADPNLGDPAPFSIALYSGRTDIVAALLDAGAVPVMHFYRSHPLEIALEQRDPAMVDLLIERTPGFEQRSDQREPMLFLALWECDLTRFVKYLGMGADPDVIDGDGRRLLETLIRLNTNQCDFDLQRERFFTALQSAGATVDYRIDPEATPLLIALAKDHLEIASRLIAAGASLEGRIGKRNFLILAALAGADDLVAVALAQGFDPSEESGDMNARNALSVASARGNADITQRLLEQGARFPSTWADFSILFGSATEHPVVLQILLEHYVELPKDARNDKAVISGIRNSKVPEAQVVLARFKAELD